MLITPTEIVKKSWETYCLYWKKFIPYMISIFSASVFLIITGILGLKIEAIVSKENLLFLNNLLAMGVSLAVLLFILWISIALTKNLRNAIERKEIINFKDSLLQNSKYIWPVIWSSFLMFFAVLGGLFLFIIPALIFSIWFTYSFYTVVFEDKSGVTALKSSKILVSGRWWKTLWLILVPTIFFGIIFLTIQNVFIFPLTIIFGEASVAYSLTKSLFINIISSIFTPLSALPMIYLYFNAKENPINSIPELPNKI